MSGGVYLWVHSEPFDVGVIPVPPPTKLTHHNLKKLHIYAKGKDKAGYPHISYPVWQHVACNKLSIDEDLAWLYFHTCMVLTRVSTGETPPTNGTEVARDKCSVDLLRFLLYLYIQHARVISLKSPVVTGDEYPATRVQDQEVKSTTGLGTKGIDERSQMSFITSNITEILDLLIEPETSGDANLSLSFEALNALSFLIGSTFDGRYTGLLSKTASHQREAQKAGYSKISQRFTCRRFESWLKAYLKRNPFGVLSCLSLGQRLKGRGFNCADESINTSLNLSHASDDTLNTNRSHIEWQEVKDVLTNGNNREEKITRIFSNANYAPDTHRHLILNQVCKRTVARCSSEHLTPSTAVLVHRCQHSHLYLLAPLRSLRIEKCHDTTLIVGAVDTCLTVVNCRNLKVVAVTKQLTVLSSSNVQLDVFVTSPPVLIGRTENIKMTPYNTWYPTLEKDMTSVNIFTSSKNYWNEPVLMGKKNADQLKVWMECPLADFTKTVIPFEFEGDTKECPIATPKRYLNALKERERRVEEWHNMVRESGLNKTQRVHLQAIVNDQFQAWLEETNSSSLLVCLAPPIPPQHR